MNGDSQGHKVRVPVALGLSERGPVFVVGGPTGRLAPEECAHEGYSSSTDFYLRCGRCGAPMRLHRLLIARKSLADIAEMERAWTLAGEPEWRFVTERVDGVLRVFGLAWDEEATAGWVRGDHPLFAAWGGLPIRPAVVVMDDVDDVDVPAGAGPVDSDD